jgi:hypothetical protein
MSPDDRLKRDFDLVENLSDLIEAREERDSAFADSVDGMEDIEEEGLPVDPVEELTFPHPHTRAEEEGRLGINVNLMDTPDDNQIDFDWQDSVEEMLPTDPEPSEGMGEDAIIESIAHVEPMDLLGPVPSVDVSPELDTAATPEEMEEYEIGEIEEYETDGGEKLRPAFLPIEMDSAMATESDEFDYTVQDKFGGQIPPEVAELEFKIMEEIAEEKETDK